MSKKASFQTAIVSHDRAETCRDKTVATAIQAGIDPSTITVFVAANEVDIYRQVLPNVTVKEGGDTLRDQRNAVYQAYPEGERVLCLDDDISRWIITWKDDVAETLADAQTFFTEAFESLERYNLRMFGIYPVANARFMSVRKRIGAWFCIGQTYGIINDPSYRHQVQIKEDWERTLWHFKHDGGVLRFENIAAVTSMRAKGGIASRLGAGRSEQNDHDAKILLRKYSQVVEERPGRGGRTDIELRMKSVIQRPRKAHR